MKIPLAVTITIVACFISFTRNAGAACPDAGSFDSDVKKEMLRQLNGLANSCVQNDAKLNPNGACNIFVGAALQTVFSVSDFFNTANSHYLTSDEMLAALPSLANWTKLGNADSDSALIAAQRAANSLKPVVAVASGHVAIIVPGKMLQSDSAHWDTCVPDSASQSIDKNGPHYVDGPLSLSWNADDRGEVQLWGRGVAPTAISSFMYSRRHPVPKSARTRPPESPSVSH